MSNLAGNLWAAQRFAHDFDPWLSAELNRLANRAREGRRLVAGDGGEGYDPEVWA